MSDTVTKDNWLDRLKQEDKELTHRYTKINTFLGTKAFYKLSEIDQHDLTVQAGGMRMYHEALQRRLRRFTSV